MSSDQDFGTRYDAEISDQTYGVWKKTFSDKVRYHQLDEELKAARNVVGVLFAIVCVGVSLALLTVMICVYFQT